MADLTLATFVDDVRKKTLKLLDGVPEDKARAVPAPHLANHLLWYAGHVYVVTEALTYGSLGQVPSYPEGWFAMFSWESKPKTVAADKWPTLGRVVEQLRSQHERIRAVVAGLDEATLARKPEAPSMQWIPSVRWGILHAFHDEANHQGETYLLKKILMQK